MSPGDQAPGTHRFILALGAFLESEWYDLWQRQQEWVSLLGERLPVLYLERAAAGRISIVRAARGALRRIRGSARARTMSGSSVFPPAPVFVGWRQVPSNSPSAAHRSASLALDAALVAAHVRGLGECALAYVGGPSEAWADLLEMLDCPVWLDMPERFRYSAAYSSLQPGVLERMLARASIVTTDTEISQQDWLDIRPDILLVPHGAKHWSLAPDMSVAREHLYYVGSMNPAVDLEAFSAFASCLGQPVKVVGDCGALISDAVDAVGWLPGGEVARYMQDGIAGLVPYKDGLWEDGIYPTKVYDYWLAGMPSIGSDLPSLRNQPHHWALGGSARIETLIDRARSLSIEERTAIREHALACTWDRRFRGVLEALEEANVEL